MSDLNNNNFNSEIDFDTVEPAMVIGEHLSEFGALVVADDPTALADFDAEFPGFESAHVERCAVCSSLLVTAGVAVSGIATAVQEVDAAIDPVREAAVVAALGALPALPVGSIAHSDNLSSASLGSIEEARSARAVRDAQRTRVNRSSRWLGVAAGIVGFAALGGILAGQGDRSAPTESMAIEASRSAEAPGQEVPAEELSAEFATETVAAAAAAEQNAPESATAKDSAISQAADGSTQASASPPTTVFLGTFAEEVESAPAEVAPEPATETVADQDASPTLRGTVLAKRTATTFPVLSPAAPGAQPPATAAVAASAGAPPAVPVPITTVATAPITTMVARSQNTAGTTTIPNSTRILAAAGPFENRAAIAKLLAEQPEYFSLMPTDHPCREVLRRLLNADETTRVGISEVVVNGTPVVIGAVLAPTDTLTPAASTPPPTLVVGSHTFIVVAVTMACEPSTVP
jgi:hypothetical protein